MELGTDMGINLATKCVWSIYKSQTCSMKPWKSCVLNIRKWKLHSVTDHRNVGTVLCPERPLSVYLQGRKYTDSSHNWYISLWSDSNLHNCCSVTLSYLCPLASCPQLKWFIYFSLSTACLFAQETPTCPAQCALLFSLQLYLPLTVNV